MDIINNYVIKGQQTSLQYIPHHSLYPNVFRILTIIFFIVTANVHLGHCQSLRSFPPLFNAARERPVLTNPSASTCGQTMRNAYCLSSTSVDSVNRCIQGYCIQTCPGRSQLPQPSNMLIATSSGFGDCVLADTVNVRPGTPSGQFSTVLARAGSTCFLSPSSSPRLDVSGVVSFTIATWLWLDTASLGTLLQKLSTSGDVLFTLQVGTTGVTLVYGSTTSDTITASMDAAIPVQRWTHVTLQVHDVSASVYINGPTANLSSSATIRLVSPVPDDDGSYRVGQSSDGSSQFLGRMQDLQFYTTALSNREVAQVYSGVFPTVRIQSECRCPENYPRVKPNWTHYCIKNGDLVTTDDTTLRISRDSHPLQYINDGDSNSMWISSFLNEVEVEVDLGDQFQFYSPLPKAVTILRQKTNSSDYEVWQYYADDCSRFGLENNGAYASPNSVNCLQFGTNGAPIPYSLGNITFNLLAPDPVARPGSNDFYNTPELHDFVRARKVRVRFEDHYYVTNIRHQYYAVYEFIVTAWCDCNGHTSQCNTTILPYTCNCLNSSNTEGIRCQRCKPLFNNKPFRKGDNLRDYPCQECICNGHADSCVYNSTLDPFPESHDQGGGGVCVNCQHFTTGRFCETCLPNYYRPNGVSLYDPAVCQPCDCLPAGVQGGTADCNKVGGQCTCKANVQGRRCDQCKPGFYALSAANIDGCLPCSCNSQGVKDGNMSCNQTTGQCNCKDNVKGVYCDECAYGFYGLAAENALGCNPCNCNPFGSTTVYCNPSNGQCQCKEKVQGLRCDGCKDGYYNFTNGCDSCHCDRLGTENGTVCDKMTGQCTCMRNVQGIYCDQCMEGTYNFGASPTFGCENCPCFVAGTVNGTGSCNKTTGDCNCKENVEGQGCDKCKPNTWGLNATDPLGCQPCGCDPTGTQLQNLSVCDQNTGQCSCLSNRQGRKCDSCVRGFYINPSGGCLACACFPTGTLEGTFCNSVTGQCECKEGDTFGVSGMNCNECLPTYYDFNARLGRCSPCTCLEAGSLNNTCHPSSGQCQCKSLVEGRECDTCKSGSSNLQASNPFGCSSLPSQQPPPEYTNKSSTSISLRWNKPDYENGVISQYNIYRNNTLVGNTSAAIRVFEDINLRPYTYYGYIIEALNAFGATRSPVVVFQTLAGKPSNDSILTVTDIRARSVFCSWTPPSDINGPLSKYVILSIKNDANQTVSEWEGTSLSVTLTTLSPYSRYTLKVRTCTVGGCADNEGVSFITQSAPPEGQQPPVITALSSSELMVTWKPPLLPNGIISFYELWFRGPQGADGQYNPPAARIFNPSGRYDPLAPPEQNPLTAPDTSYNVTGLLAFTFYEFQVLSENDAGKAASIWVKGRTQEAFPISVPPPSVTGISSSELLISWTTPPPESMQGLVQTYRIYQSVPKNATEDPFGPPQTWLLIYEGGGDAFNNTVTGLTPYSEHSFTLEACNGKGCINSTAANGRTLIAAPEGVQNPRVEGYNTTAMEISWEEPLFPNGPPPSYKVQKTNIALSFPASVVRGTRFTGGSYYAFEPSVIPQSVAFTGIRFRFRLERGTGLLLFTATSTQEEFLAVQFVNGRPRLLFDTQGNCGARTILDYDSFSNWTSLVNTGFHTLEVSRYGNTGTLVVDGYFRGCNNIAFVTTTNDEGLVYNDRKWHTFEARRTGITGIVTVDEKWRGESFIRDSSCSSTSIIGPTTAVYVGGFPPDFHLKRVDRNRQVEESPLQGCIDNIEIMQQLYPEEVWTSLDFTKGITSDLSFLNWQGCPINLESGFHFMGKGYLVIANCADRDCDVSGSNIQVRFRMRTPLHSGLLFLIYGGTGIYMYGVLENGKIRFAISDNNVLTEVTYDDPDVNFCDGEWRLLIFDKIGQQASISVPQFRTVSIGDPNVDMPLGLTSYIYLGGLKPGSEPTQYVQENGLVIPGEGFGGCFSGFQINGKKYDDDMKVIDVANTNLDGCPPYYQLENGCQSNLITQVYQGMGTVAYDTGLLPYTDYIYRVGAVNDAGEGYSSWSYGRTREGAPSGVKGPNSLRAITGNEIEVIWEEPDITYGLLTKFVVMAYEDGDQNGTFVSMDITDVTHTAVNMTGVIPDTFYLVKIQACTPGGCTESEDGMNVTTPIEAPEDVAAPTAQTGPTYLFVEWEQPGKPNGPSTGYFLYQDGIEVYQGGRLNYNVTDLQVYTSYRFYISACTSAGCTDGPVVSLTTSQLPPTAVNAPTLLVLDTSRIKASWEVPSQLNGVLDSYHLYASTVEGELGVVVYNNTDLFPDFVIEDLLAGTTYYIVLGACTSGGCTLSPAASATTEESAPEGVPAPVVTSPSPTELVVTWNAPSFPNGVIVRYDLYQNGAEVFSGLNQTYRAVNLQPYSRHLFRVRACTVEGCAYSDEVEARTLEALPQGTIVLNVTVVDARTVNVTWSIPANVNGLMMYRVYFNGTFYQNPEAWNYSIITERRQLLNTTVGYTAYEISPLVPMSNYSIQVNGSNSVGFIPSNVVNVMLPPSTPDGMAPPDLISETPNSIKVTWRPVGRVNAPEDPAYLLQFMETTETAIVQDEFGPTVTLSYTKTNLLPFTEYKFRVIASNSYGETQSPWASLVTKQDKPASMNVPLISGVKSRYVDITWSVPLSPNGIISQYNVYANGNLKTNVAGNVTSLRVDNLVPYTYYTFDIEACTVGGCTRSLPSSTVRTLEDVPEGLSAPVLAALSPSAVQIKYTEPSKPNGVISQYIIERKLDTSSSSSNLRLATSENVTVVATRTASMAKTFVDESNDLSPFSVYSYRVNVQNGAGTALSPWSQITTGSSRPAGINPPQITSISPTSVLVRWSPPLQPNGQIETYVIRFPDPRIEVRNTTQLAVVVNDLRAYTEYSVTVTACTTGGCTESIPTSFVTNTTVPAGQAAPVATAVSQSRISILWQAPTLPNGPNITYELSRMKVRQPLDTTVTDTGTWQSLYRGGATFYEDTGLPMFTTYVYRITVFNSVGQFISPNSTEVTTFGGLPRLPANVTAEALDHLRIMVNWTLPSPVELQGDVQSLTLQAKGPNSTKTDFPEPTQRGFTMENLAPNTEYSVTLTVTIFGGANITSVPVLVTTKDGAPAGLSPPRLAVVSTSALRVSWTAPTQPNGAITAYHILVNDRKIDTGSSLPGSYVVDQLQPYTVYDVRIEACTVFACTVSSSVYGTTAEALPQGMSAPVVTANSPSSATVIWRQPDRPNGIIQRYDLMRKTLQSCADVPAPTVNPEFEKCTYIECGVFENLCGSTCYSGAKVCCDGKLHDSMPSYACCGTEYVPKARADYVCCGGEFHEPQTNYKCCGVRYTEVLPGEICCADPNEDRVSTSQGDQCCGSIPFMSSGAQICCDGILLSKLGQQCCAGKVISDTTVCCGDENDGQMYLQNPGYSCCGHSYVETALSLCCTIKTGTAKVHFYDSAQEKQVASDKCCGLSRISRNLGCCNYVGYNQLTQVCADRSPQDSSCGTGVVCPLSQQSTAYCDRCDFDNTRQTCMSVPGYLDELPDTPDPTSTCTTETQRIYSGLNLNYTDYGLMPYSQYEYSVVVVNSAGTTSSAYTPIRTLEAVPEIVSPPTARIDPGELYAIYLIWDAPQKPNGIITRYILRRDGVELYSGMATNFTDDLNILPYRSYSYILTACNSAGCANSTMVKVATAQATPEDLLPPDVTVVNSTTLRAIAQSPGKPNGVILTYRINVLDLGTSYNSSSPQEFLIDGLTPFTSYTLDMVVCTVVGCATSSNVTVTTSEALPEGLLPPRVIVISSTSIDLYWRAPDVLNGIIQEYRVIKTKPTPVAVVYMGSGTNVRLSDLTPGQAYTYQLQVTNGAGSIQSVPREIIMPLQTPLNVPPPQSVKVLSSTSIQVQWLPITSDQGEIDQYRILLNIGQESELERGVGLQTRITIPDLDPFTNYEVRLQACLRNVLNGCGTSSGVVVTTEQDTPEGMGNPKLIAIASDAVHVMWDPPTKPNGVITTYRIFQRLPNKTDSEILINQVLGSFYEFVHSGQDLKPYQVYEYKVVAVNVKGEAASGWTSVRTLQAPPAGLAAPLVNNISTYGISISWSPPQSPNGPIKEYRIFYQRDPPTSETRRNFINVGGNVRNTSISGLEAYSTYLLYLEAVNDAGSLRSSSVSFTTKEGYPAGLSPLAVEKISTGTAVILSWNIPQKPNGVITNYRIYEASSVVAIYSGIAREFEFRRLMPYTEYYVKLEACTKVGCTLSKIQSFYTAEIAPSAQPSPTFGTINSTNVQIKWKPPLNPNGVITSYEVLRVSSALRRKRDISSAVLQFFPSDSQLHSITYSSAAPQFLSEPCTSADISYIERNPTYPNDFLNNNKSIISCVQTMARPDDVSVLTRVKRQSENAEVVFRTLDTNQDEYEYTDSGLKPYTGYKYSVRASNSLGFTDSPWQTVQTQQAAPEGVQPPQLSHIDNDINSITVTWSLPAQMNGVLQSYQIQRNASVPYSFPASSERRFVDTGLSAFTTYSYTLSVCTGGGCTTSVPATITTKEAAPMTVSPPTVVAVNSTAIRATWTKPVISNGQVTEYKLKMDKAFVYTGLQQTYVVTGLVPYQSHVFTLTVCTNGGCTESGEVTGRSDDAPPTGLSPPILIVISSTTIEVTWAPPANPNGVISSYDVRRDGRLIYTNSIAASSSLKTSYMDFNLEPGEEYSYTIVARNRKGSIESGPSKAVTFSASPSGLAAPTLTPVSSTSIKVDWAPPANPNGLLTNYTIYQGTSKVYTGNPSQLSYTVPGLQYYTEYTFRVEACTSRGCEVSAPSQARTLSARPENQPVPSLVALANEQGAHAGVRVSWEPPTKPNGVIDHYELQRREVLTATARSIDGPILVYNGSETVYVDNSSQLLPYHEYQYMIISVNSVGKAGSSWVSVTTKEAPPEGILPPLINSTSSSTITVTARAPQTPNGQIRLYRILVNGTAASSSPALLQTVGLTSPLLPYTTYELRTEACTSGGCGQSEGVITRTDSAKPMDLNPIRVVAVTSNSVQLEWSPPSRPNGVITKYEVYQRYPCPPTFQPFDQTCVVGVANVTYAGLDQTFIVNNLDPYRAYEFQVQAFNDKGGVDFPVWVRAETAPSAPVYSRYPRLSKEGNQAVISWGNSFTLNGRLKEYILLANGKAVFRDITSEHGVEMETNTQIIEFIIQVITYTNQTESPVIVFDPNAVNNIGTTKAPPVSQQTESDTAFYEEIWFIVLMCIIALVILFIALALCIRGVGPRQPYIRERMPLHRQPHNKFTRDLYVIDAADGSVIDSNGMSPAHFRDRNSLYQGPGVGIINPAFSQDGELGRISPGKLSKLSGRYFDEDDLRMGRPYDSGLFDDMDTDSNSGHTYSYTKEQTVFTDTHL